MGRPIGLGVFVGVLFAFIAATFSRFRAASKSFFIFNFTQNRTRGMLYALKQSVCHVLIYLLLARRLLSKEHAKREFFFDWHVLCFYSDYKRGMDLESTIHRE